jgi:transcriptional regulator with XRE-family HTH domain
MSSSPSGGLVHPVIVADFEGNFCVDASPESESDQPLPPPGEGEGDHKQPDQFAERLLALLATRRNAAGLPYTLTEVSRGTGLALPYLSTLRKGRIEKVPFKVVETIARFFHVPLEYFSHYGPPVDLEESLVQEALAKPLVREVVLRASRLATPELALVLGMIEHAKQVLHELKTPPAAPPDEARRPQQDEEAV